LTVTLENGGHLQKIIYLFFSSLKIKECSPLKVYCKMYRFQDPNGGTVKK
jgi:hypothetical protein